MKPRIPSTESASLPSGNVLELNQDCIEQLEEALAAAPFLKTVRWSLARAYWNSGKLEDASQTLNESATWPSELPLLEFAGEVYLKCDRTSALELFEEFVFQHPRHQPAHEALAELYTELGRDEEARTHTAAAEAIGANPLDEIKVETPPVRARVDRVLKKRNRSDRSNAVLTAILTHAIATILLALWFIGKRTEPGNMLVHVVAETAASNDPSSQFLQQIQQKPQPSQQASRYELTTIPQQPITIDAVGLTEFETDLHTEFAELPPLDQPDNARSGIDGKTRGTVEFFGQRSQAERVVFVVDFSTSMHQGQRLPNLKRELAKSVAGLPEGMPYNIIYYSDSAWLGSSAEGRYTNEATWVIANAASKRTSAREIANMNAEGSTYWAPPMRIALAMEPKPDLIWLLSDGDAVDRRNLLKKVGRLLDDDVRINTIGLELGGEPFQSLVDLAQKTGGSYSIIIGGIQYNGEEALRFTNQVYGKGEY